jgi:hypothetical protein
MERLASSQPVGMEVQRHPPGRISWPAGREPCHMPDRPVLRRHHHSIIFAWRRCSRLCQEGGLPLTDIRRTGDV